MATEQPKRPMSAFLLFCSQVRPGIVKELGTTAPGPVLRLVGARWKEVKASARVAFQKKAAALKVTFANDMAAFKEAGGQMKGKKRKNGEVRMVIVKGKQVKDKNAPKRPVGGAFSIYRGDHRVEIQESLPPGSGSGAQAFAAISNLASARWKLLSEKGKKPYEKKYQAKVVAYKAAMEAYEPPPAEGIAVVDDSSEEDEAPPPPPKRARK